MYTKSSNKKRKESQGILKNNSLRFFQNIGKERKFDGMIKLQKANFERHRNFSPNHLSEISDEIRPHHRR
ncbi:hypothetical protein BBF96_00555 [Anoxybacter fermentans]|uniref:Uncharacterized protein n=1 Tax=Anoxybacter fermentans TaxID=1323375 RepID=A0A3Q9HQ00_9FIRM|nr:hypothetical protein BBF96_00555 [Anoxybacter fermentans]